MVVGKTSSSISITELFNTYSEIQILTTVFPQINKIPCKIQSPFRKDSNPSFGIYTDDNQHIKFKDFGDSKMQGGLLDLLCRYWECSFHQVFEKILEVMENKKPCTTSIKPKHIKVISRKENTELTKIEVAVRAWKDYDYKYWSSYGIEKKWLKYADIYPISHKIITKRDIETGKQNKYIFPTDKYAYVFVEKKDGKTQLKIYQPFNDKGYKWCSRMDASVWGLWTKIPQEGNNLIISSSIKDCLNISCQLHIPAICMQGEGYIPKPQVIEELKERYKNIIVFFDNDYDKENNPGQTDAIKLVSEYNLKMVEIPAKYKAKDPSDLFLKYGKEQYHTIMQEILNPVLI